MTKAQSVLIALMAVLAGVGTLGAPGKAKADFGLNGVSFSFENEDETPATLAGTHPFSFTTRFNVNTRVDPSLGVIPDGEIKDLQFRLPVGFVGNPTATPRCSNIDFLTKDPFSESTTSCPDDAAVGTAAIQLFSPGNFQTVPVFNLQPSPGVAAKLGFAVTVEPITIELGVKGDYPYNVTAGLLNTPQAVKFYGSTVKIWGNPPNASHDALRGHCLKIDGSSLGSCPSDAEEKPFLTLPRSCADLPALSYVANSWQEPAHNVEGSVSGERLEGCDEPGFDFTIAATPTTSAGESASGLDFDLDVEDRGLTSSTGRADADIKKVVATLPEGVTVNPSAAQGLQGCSTNEFARESVDSQPGQGCPQASTLGTVAVETPLLEGEQLSGFIYQAQPDNPATAMPGTENPFDAFLALYVVIRSEKLGIIIKQAGKIEANPQTGQLVTTFDRLPQLPFSHFRLQFRSGARAPLVTPTRCGAYTTKAELTPWVDPSKAVTSTSTFHVSGGPGGSCISGDLPFHPGFTAGTLSSRAGSFSPFVMRIARNDGEAEIQRLSSILPPGLLGKLAGIGKCPDSAITSARSKTGAQELAEPSCPAGSQIGEVIGGAGAGTALTYVRGKLYLAGSFGDDPLSVVAIVPAVTGPFDVGNVMTRVGLNVNPATAEVQIDGANSDPVPHILKGIPLRLRDLRIQADRPSFILNPTNCNPFTVRASILAAQPEALSSTVSASPSEGFQASGCRALPFKPHLSLKLKGGTKRGASPSLHAVLRARPGDANIGRAVVTLPHSVFLEQAHIRTICTRVQFAAHSCPKGAIYGRASAVTPLLDEPLVGPVYLRSSDDVLPNLVADLHGVVNIELVGKIDSKKGRLRTTFASVPDAPVKTFVLDMQGGKKSLITNSKNLCVGVEKADVSFTAQNRRKKVSRPIVKDACRKNRQKPAGHR